MPEETKEKTTEPKEIKEAAVPTPTVRKRRRATTLTQIEKDLKEIYGSESPNDLANIQKTAKRGPWPILAGVVGALLILAGLGWVGMLTFGRTNNFSGHITLTIDGPAVVKAGETETWTVLYKNEDRLPLARSEVALRLPHSIQIIDATPTASSAPANWTIGALEPGAQGKIEIRARALETLSGPLSLQAVLSYRPANFNADFEKIASWDGAINGSVIEATMAGPDETIPAEDSTFTLKIKQAADAGSDVHLPNLKIRFDPDRYLLVKKATPSFASGDERAWIVPLPAAGKETTLTVIGSFVANTVGDIAVRAEIGTLDAENRFITLAPAQIPVKVLQGDLSLDLIRNGSASRVAVDFGSPLHISVDYENKSTKPIGDAEIRLTAAGSLIDWQTLADPRKAKRDGDTLIWTKKEIPELELLKPGDKGSIDLSIGVVETPPTGLEGEISIDLSARGIMGTLGGKKSGKTVSTPVMQTSINSNTKIATTILYKEGTLPPRSNQTTTYRAVWTITNSLHELAGIKVTAALPPKVAYVGSGNVPAGDLRYDETTRIVTWTLNRLPPSIPLVSVDFLIALTPGSEDVSKTMPLIADTTMLASDKQTDSQIIRTEKTQKTDLPDDPTHEGQGIIQP